MGRKVVGAPNIAPPAGQWDRVKFPEFAQDPGAKLAPEDTDTGTAAWTEAPADSHVHSFRYLDARASSFMQKFGGGVSRLEVRFKATKRSGVTYYVYLFQDAARGREVFEQMQAASSPGEVVHHVLIARSIPYQRLA